VEYYRSFLEGHQHAEVASYTGGQNLAALVNRITLSANSAERASFIQLRLSERRAQLVYYGLWLAVLLLFVAKLVRLRIRRSPISAFELTLIFLTSLLLSPITFTTHLVSLLFVFYTFLSVRLSGLSPRAIGVAALLCLAMAVTGLSGRDLVGSTVYWFVRDHSIYAWTLLLLFAAAVVLAGRDRAPTATPATPQRIPPGR
jgi:hypothetical protein